MKCPTCWVAAAGIPPGILEGFGNGLNHLWFQWSSCIVVHIDSIKKTLERFLRDSVLLVTFTRVSFKTDRRSYLVDFISEIWF